MQEGKAAMVPRPELQLVSWDNEGLLIFKSGSAERHSVEALLTRVTCALTSNTCHDLSLTWLHLFLRSELQPTLDSNISSSRRAGCKRLWRSWDVRMQILSDTCRSTQLSNDLNLASNNFGGKKCEWRMGDLGGSPGEGWLHFHWCAIGFSCFML